MEAERYNEAYELIADEDITLQLTNSRGKQFNYTFTANNNRYALLAGTLPPDNYTYIATAERFGKKETKKGSFRVQPLQLEFAEHKANTELMRELAATTGGITVAASNIIALADSIKANNRVKPIVQERTQTLRWIDWKWLFFLLLALFTIEWAIRKWHGHL
jgi:hypothetical protein